MARSSFKKQMRQWRKRSRERDVRGMERVIVNAEQFVVTPERVQTPRLSYVSVSLEEHGLVVTSGRTRKDASENASLRQSFRRSFTSTPRPNEG